MYGLTNVREVLKTIITSVSVVYILTDNLIYHIKEKFCREIFLEIT